MNSLWKASVAIAACLVTAAIILIIGRALYPALAAVYPDTWLQVKPGMISDRARQLLGKPWADGRDLKVVDRWRQTQNGVEMHLDLWFDDRNNGTSTIIHVARWKTFLGADTDKHMDPPWQRAE